MRGGGIGFPGGGTFGGGWRLGGEERRWELEGGRWISGCRRLR